MITTPRTSKGFFTRMGIPLHRRQRPWKMCASGQTKSILMLEPPIGRGEDQWRKSDYQADRAGQTNTKD